MHCRLVVVALLLVTGCATSPPDQNQRFQEVSQARAGLATVYIYRPPHEVARMVWPEVFLNDQKVVGLRDQAYTVVHLKPGSYRVRTEKNSPFSGMGNIPGAFEIPAEGSYFLKLDRSYNQGTEAAGPYATRSPTFTTNYERWVLVPRDSALKEISTCYFIAPYIGAITQ